MLNSPINLFFVFYCSLVLATGGIEGSWSSFLASLRNADSSTSTNHKPISRRNSRLKWYKSQESSNLDTEMRYNLDKLADDPSLSPSLKRRVVAVGDLHGDFEATSEVLKLAGLIDDDLDWTGGRTMLVQTGDIMDRGKNALEIFKLFDKLSDQAEQVNGHVQLILGNHEVYNLLDMNDYVSDEELESFGLCDTKKLRTFHEKLAHREACHHVREQLLGPSGYLGQKLRKMDTLYTVGSSLFAHAGVSFQTSFEFTPHQFNDYVRHILEIAETPVDKQNAALHLFGGHLSPLVYNEIVVEDEVDVCNVLKLTLKNWKRLIVGHTVQTNGRIGRKCYDFESGEWQLYAIDVGMSRNITQSGNRVGIAALEVLEYQNGSTVINALYPGHSKRLQPNPPY